MISYTERHIEPEDYKLYLKIKEALSVFDESRIDYGVNLSGEVAELSCHMLSEALSRIFPDELVLENGYYYVGFQHSWLVTKNRNILDVYPFGIISGPLLIARQALTSRKIVYIPKEDIMDEIRECVGYDHAVDLVEAELRQILNQL